MPAEAGSGQCCGKCKPVACVVEGTLYPIGQTWASPDFCTNYTCVHLNGTVTIFIILKIAVPHIPFDHRLKIYNSSPQVQIMMQ